MLPSSYRVRTKKQETADVVTLELEPVDGESFSFEPGQFNMIYAYGVGEVPISISGDPTRDGPVLHTIRDVGPVTEALCRAPRGEVVGVRGPFGTHWDTDTAEGHDIVLVAGGIGLAPLRPALYKLLAERDKFGRIVLLFGARSPEHVLFREQLEHWRGRFDLQVEVSVDYAAPGWRGHVGVVSQLLPRAPIDPANTIALVCGPEIMMRSCANTLLDRGVPPERIRVSMERNMKCGVGLCGHCQFGPVLVCRDGPVVTFDRVAGLVGVHEL